jgi:PAS domain S-box-containing protein
MTASDLLRNLPNLVSVIDRQPLTVPADMPLVEVVALMSQPQGCKCLLNEHEAETITVNHRSSALVLENGRLVGIFTERDLVKITSTQSNLPSVNIAAVMTVQPQTLVLKADQTVMTAWTIFKQHHIRHLPILDNQFQLLGIVTPEQIRQVLQPIHLLKFRAVAAGMTAKVIQATGTTPVLQIVKLMTKHQVSSIVIVKKSRSLQPVGIITERDILQFQAFELQLDQLLAQDVMSSPLFCMQLQDSMWSAQQIMQAKNIRRLVVTDEQGQLRGIVTQSNLLQFLDPLEMLCMVEDLQEQLFNRATELEKSNQELRLEVTRRQQVEDNLEQRVLLRTAELELRSQQLQAEINDREEAEKELRRSEAQFRTLFTAVPVGIFQADIQGNCLFANPKCLQLMGLSDQAAQGQGWLNAMHPSDRQQIFSEWDEAVKNQRDFTAEHRFITSTGQVNWCSSSVIAAYDQAGKVMGYLGTVMDINARKAGEQKIREQAALLDIATDGIIVRNLESQIQFWNKGAASIYGWSAAEAIGQSTVQLFYPHVPDTTVETAWQKVLTTGLWQGELLKTTKQGNQVVIESHWTLVRDDDNNPCAVLSVDTDVTEKNLLEKQFLRTQRLESLGTLASGIAHDLNNVLTPIVGAAQLLPHTLPNLDSRNQRLLQMMTDSAKRGSALVKQILTFARGLDGQRTTLQIRHLLSEIVSVARQTFPKSIEIILDVNTNDLWLVLVDATQIHQVLMNLFVNARDAIIADGKIVAAAENLVIDAANIHQYRQIPVGSYVLITITDSGIGMDSKVLAKIFDPFFTTKETGTGLGLSTVSGIIKAHGGFVDVESKVNQGSCFKLYLPAINSQETDEQTEKIESWDGHGSLVLVVDDELAVRQITKESLEAYNYRVLLASDGVEAIAQYVQDHSEIDVVILDMMMPNLDTPSIMRALQRINPCIPIIVMSGSDSANAQAMIDQQGAKSFLTKPFTTNEMLQAIQNID